MKLYLQIAALIYVLGIAGCEHPDQFIRNNPLDPESGLLYTPTSPSGLIITAHSDTNIEIEWEINSLAEAGFVIERKSENEEDFTIIGTVDAGINTFSDTSGIVTDRYYYYRVGVFGEAQEKFYSDVKSILLEFPDPMYLKVRSIGMNSVELIWNYQGTFHDGFIVERRKKDEDKFQIITTLDKDQNSLTDTALDSDKIYAYRIYAYTSINKSNDIVIKILYGPHDLQMKYEVYDLPKILDISFERSLIVTLHNNHYPSIRNLVNGEILHIFNDIPAPSEEGIRFSRDGSLLTARNGYGSMGLWRTSDYQMYRIFSTNQWDSDIRRRDTSNNNQYLSATTWDGYIYLWNISDWDRVNETKLTDMVVSDIFFSDNDNYLFVIHWDRTITKLTIPELQEAGRLDDISEYQIIHHVSDNSIVLAGPQYISIIDFSSSEAIYKKYRIPTYIKPKSVALSLSEKYVYIVDTDGNVFTIHIDKGISVPVTMSIPYEIVEQMFLSNDGETFVMRNESYKLVGFEIGNSWSLIPFY